MSAGERPLPEWAREASLGIFVHWGAYSVPAWAEPIGALGAVPDDEWFAHNAYAEWYANTIRIEGSPAAEHHAREYGGAPYEAFLDAWRAESYDPADWASLFASIGADYVVPTTKHHDGIALWDAPGSGSLTTVARGPRRDLIAPLAEAVRAEGLRFGVYYSGGLDWAFADFPPHRSSDDVDALRPIGMPRTTRTRAPTSPTSSSAIAPTSSGTTSTGPTPASCRDRTRSSRCSRTTEASCPRAS